MKTFLYSVYKRFVTWVGDIMVATKPPKTKADLADNLMAACDTVYKF